MSLGYLGLFLDIILCNVLYPNEVWLKARMPRQQPEQTLHHQHIMILSQSIYFIFSVLLLPFWSDVWVTLRSWVLWTNLKFCLISTDFTKCVSLVAGPYIIYSSSKYLSGHLFSILSLMEVSLLSFVVIVINVEFNSIVQILLFLRSVLTFTNRKKVCPRFWSWQNILN